MVQLVPPPLHVARTRELAYETVATVLEDVLFDSGLCVSPLGPGWSRDVDAHVRRVPDPRVLEAAGWVDLDALLARVGYRTDGRWAVVLAHEVIGAADLKCGTPPDPVTVVLERIRRLGYVGAREAAELAKLRACGYAVPRAPHPRHTPVVRRCRVAIRNRLRPRELVEIVGADPLVRSALSARLVEDLIRAGVPATRARASEVGAVADVGGGQPAHGLRRTAARLGTWHASRRCRGIVVVDFSGSSAAGGPGPEAGPEHHVWPPRAAALPPALVRVILDDPVSTTPAGSVPRGSGDERRETREGAPALRLPTTRPVAQLSLTVLRYLATVSRA